MLLSSVPVALAASNGPAIAGETIGATAGASAAEADVRNPEPGNSGGGSTPLLLLLAAAVVVAAGGGGFLAFRRLQAVRPGKTPKE